MWINTPNYQSTGLPLHFSRTPGAFRSAPPHFAAHTDEVLSQLGYNLNQVAQLEAEGGVVRQRERLTAEA
jgi:crotonobetainyl-CoA:carnitine CoA-transferase CaiB-like acyl-CoA transferase